MFLYKYILVWFKYILNVCMYIFKSFNIARKESYAQGHDYLFKNTVKSSTDKYYYNLQ